MIASSGNDTPTYIDWRYSVEGKTCTVCDEFKYMDMFYNRKASDDGKAYRCKECDKIAGRGYRSRNRERHLRSQRQANWKFKYKLSREQFEIMWDCQLGMCAICSIPMIHVELDDDSRNKSNTCNIDHCHESGEVRGLLCARCNKALGLFDDSCASLESAIRYLSPQIH